MDIDLTKCFPKDKNGNHGPLPKQRLFLDVTLDPNKSKFIAYIGGVGSGKTLCGCIAILTQAIMHPGDYLICRLYLPELKITTLKTFLEVCPKELIIEHRIADGIIRLKSRNGISTIIFRGLEEPDKLRSLNLSGFYIDEANQVSENAFMLLQGRLRGNGLRKGILTSNPKGHDYLYRWFVKQDHIKSEKGRQDYFLIKAPSTENIHLPDGYVQSMMEAWSDERVQREIMASFDSFEGMVYPEFRRDVHVIKPFVIPKEWTRIIGIDHGYRNPACWLWAAVDYDDNIYVYREFYHNELTIKEICHGKKEDGIVGVVALSKGERISGAFIDPSTNHVRSGNESDFSVYREHLPGDFPLTLANNSVETGIDRIKSYLKVNPITNKPSVFIFDTCYNLLEEISKYRYQELKESRVGKANEKELPLKVDDHAMDAWRYLMMSRPERPIKTINLEEKFKDKGFTAEYYLQKELQNIKKPKSKDPFQDY